MIVPHRVACYQIAGKSLRYNLHGQGAAEAATEKTVRDVVSLNEIMYARLANKAHTVSCGPTVLAQVARKCRGQATRGDAVRIIKSIFPDAVGDKRLPKRLVNLIPLVQEMIKRVGDCDITALADRIIPLRSQFRKFMNENVEVKKLVAERAHHASKWGNSAVVDPLVLKVLEEEYVSQSEDEEHQKERKRKRREEAVEAVSDVAMYVRLQTRKPDLKKQRVPRLPGATVANASPSNLEKLQEHKYEIKELLTCSTPKRLVYRYVRKLLASIVPKEIWADKSTKSNWNSVKEVLRKLVFARKYDLISLKKVSA